MPDPASIRDAPAADPVGVGVRLAPGTGHVVRRNDALLFLPRPDPTVLAAFADASAGDELQAVASSTVAAGFEVSPYVCISWPRPTRVMVFGDLAVETDQPSVPMLSGAGSRTWVEHTIALTGPATISVAGDGVDIDVATDLVTGTVHGGGFVLELTPAESSVADHAPVEPPAVEVAEDIADDVATPTSDPTTALGLVRLAAPETETTAPEHAAPPVDPSEPTMAVPAGDEPFPEPVPAPAVEPAVEPQPAAPRPTRHDVSSGIAGDPAAALAAIQAAAMNEDGEPVQQAAIAEPEHVPMEPTDGSSPDVAPAELDDDFTLPPPEPGELLAEIDGAGHGALVEAKICAEGHPNPPMVAVCAICGALLAPGRTATSNVRRPSLGHLRLDDGVAIELDDELLIGRSPARDSDPARAALRRVQVLGDKVSRSHLEVRYQGWDVLISDCGSTNGTFVVPHPGGQVAALAPHRPQLVEAGAVVYFGSRSCTVVARNG